MTSKKLFSIYRDPGSSNKRFRLWFAALTQSNLIRFRARPTNGSDCGSLRSHNLTLFVRAISSLLLKRNGVAIIATHSPVVLQEVPRSCVWKIRRTGLTTKVERPRIETFGENVIVLTRHIFGLEVTHSGFHGLLRDAIENENLDYDELLQKFDNQLGAEAKAIAQGLLADRHDD